MMIQMSGINYNTADISIREKFSIKETCLGNFAKQIQSENNLLGCIIISTCNRTEIYISSSCPCDPALLLQKSLGFNREYTTHFISLHSDEAIKHLMETTAGLNSQIFGDDQIISQVKKSLAASHDAKATDSVLETLFRNAITAAKKVKTNVRLGAISPSVALASVEHLEKYFGNFSGRKALVIGNGEMGRIVSGQLVECGAFVTVTIREYKNKPVIIPNGCNTTLFSERYNNFDQYDFVVSATTSPHYTITLSEIQKLQQFPHFFMDLALPRDIDPQIADLGIKICNIDSLVTDADLKKIGLAEAQEIIAHYQQKFYDWQSYTSYKV